MSAPVRAPKKPYSSRTNEPIKNEHFLNARKKTSAKAYDNDDRNGNKKNCQIYEHRKANGSCPILKAKGTSFINANSNANPNSTLKWGSLNNQVVYKSKITTTHSERNKKRVKELNDEVKEHIQVPPNNNCEADLLETHEDDAVMLTKKENEEKTNDVFTLKKNTVEQYDKRKQFCHYLLSIKNFKSLLIGPAFKDPKYRPTEFTKKAWSENPTLNRFNDVFCIDSTRVILKRHLLDINKPVVKSNFSHNSYNHEAIQKKKNDYIHANYVKIPNSDYVYICTQGPLPNTVEDFLLMCWQDDCKVIVMLCELKEDNTEKCSKYWPEPKEIGVYGRIRVYNEREDSRKYEGIVIRTLKVQLGEARKVIIQFQLKSWPDHLVPPSSSILVTLLREVQLISSRNPIVVHCSAGIGRTGTFMGIHYASERFKNQKDGDITLLDVIREMRTQRLQSVQTTIQYAYLNICLLEYFALDNIIEYDDKVKQFIEKNISFIQEYARRLLAKRNKLIAAKNKNTQD
uniref:Protein-tyrosine-phosphatase n=1 Tax=Strongyloides stercoralis TaxID=6248 RepID=A0A0K0EKE9_STRER